MNVKELKEAIEYLPDDFIIVVKVPCSRSEPYDYYGVERETIEGIGTCAYGEELDEESIVNFRSEQKWREEQEEDDNYLQDNCVALLTW